MNKIKTPAFRDCALLYYTEPQELTIKTEKKFLKFESLKYRGNKSNSYQHKNS